MSGGRAAAEGSIESESSPKMFASDLGLGYPTSAGTAKTEILVYERSIRTGLEVLPHHHEMKAIRVS